MTKQQIQVGDTVRVHDYDGRVSEPVTVTELWGDQGQATVTPAVFGARYWNVETMEKVAA